MNINAYLARSYPNPPCWTLVADVYRSELHYSVYDPGPVIDGLSAYTEAFRIGLLKNKDFVQVHRPADFTVVLMAKAEKMNVHHCGIFYRSQVLHAVGQKGVLYQDLYSLKDEYKRLEYWQYVATNH